MGFEDRLTKAKIVEKRFIDWCKKNNISYAYTGIEQMKRDSPEIRNELMKFDTESALNMRFFPDMNVLGKDAWLIDLKWGSFLEKEAYESYYRLSLSGFNVSIVNLKKDEDKLIFIPIDNLKFKDVSNWSLPNDGKWIYPRNLPPDKYQEWKKSSEGAGTAHGLIDYDKTIYSLLKEEKEIIIKESENSKKEPYDLELKQAIKKGL